MSAYAVLLSIHIAAGATALVTAAGALATSKGGRWHVYAGRVFALAMLIVFLTALPMTFLRPNLFLFLVAVFSFYLVLTGWFRARNRGGTPRRAEGIAALIMTVAALGMAIRGIMLLVGGTPWASCFSRSAAAVASSPSPICTPSGPGNPAGSSGS